MNTTEKSVAQIGLGAWGINILRNLERIGVLALAYDRNEERVAELRKQFPDVPFTSSIEEIFANPEIKAVAIASPAATHYRIVKEALEAGKDVFVEKPMALRLKEGLELQSLAKRRDRILMVGHVLQYHPAVRKLKEMVHEGALGKVYYMYSNRLNIGRLRTEENILWSFAPHDISVMLSLIGEDPVRAHARGGDYLNSGVFDTTMSTLEFKNGVKGHVFVSWLHPYKEQKFVVVGSEGMAVFDDMAANKLVVFRHNIRWHEGRIPVAEKAEGEVIPLEQGEPLRLELEHFVQCIRTRERPRTDAVEAVKVLQVLQILEECLHTVSGKEIVQPIDW